MQRHIAFRILTVVGSSVIGLSLAALALFLYLKWSQATQRDVDPRVHQLLGLQVGLDEHYLRLMEELTDTEDEFFAALDTFHGISMSKRLFLPTDMYGEDRYRFRPNMRICEVNIWTGVGHHNLQIPATATIDALLEKCTLRHRVYFETNEHGFKKTALESPPGAVVMFFLGDSYTEGMHTEAQDTFVSLVGQRFQADGIPVAPMNLGVGGFGVREECWMLEHYGPLLKPRVVLLNLFPNDVQRDEFAVVRGVGVPEHRYQEFFNYLNRIADYCQRTGARLVVAAIPSSSQVDSLREHSAFQDRVGAWCETKGLTFVDLLDEFLASEETLYIPWDAHLTVAGHRLYADILFRATKTMVAEAWDSD